MYEINSEEAMFFDQYPDMLPIYIDVMTWLTDRYDDVSVKVGKTAISIRNRFVFAMVSLPWRRMAGWPKRFLLFSIGLAYHRESPRVAYAAEPYPNRWNHHIIVRTKDEFDDELKDWLIEAYEFCNAKRGGKKH